MIACCLLAVCSMAQTGATPAADRLLARVPEGLELAGPPITGPDGSTVEDRTEFVFSPDGTQVAYVAFRGGRPVPVLGESIGESIGERVGESLDYVDPPVFAPSGVGVGFRVGQSTGPKTEHWWILLEGKRQFQEDWIGSIACAPDGARWAYWAQPGARVQSDRAYAQKDLVLVVGKRRSKAYEDADALNPPQFSPDGKKVASVAMKGGRWYVLVIGAKEELLGDGAPMIDSILWHPDGKELAVVEVREDSGLDPEAPPPDMGGPFGDLVVRVGKRTYGKDYDSAGAPVFSRDGRHIAYKVMRGGKMGVARDDDAKAPTAWAYVDELVFSPDGKRLAFRASEDARTEPAFGLARDSRTAVKGGTWRLVVDNHSGPVLDEVRLPCFSPDGKLLAYAARKGARWHVVAGERSGPEVDEVASLAFAADGKSVSYGARSERELWWRTLAIE